MAEGIKTGLRSYAGGQGKGNLGIYNGCAGENILVPDSAFVLGTGLGNDGTWGGLAAGAGGRADGQNGQRLLRWACGVAVVIPGGTGMGGLHSNGLGGIHGGAAAQTDHHIHPLGLCQLRSSGDQFSGWVWDHAVIVHTGHTCVSQAFFDLGVQFCHRRELGDGHQHGLFPIAGSKGPRLGDAAGAEDDLGGGKIIKVLHFIHSF
ncbi:Uncharacterised protein [Flavonifractor plautii]|uniref:Uncharacterized protein n=1 Tax=Flavonifractor plautii TaxID=292800 RepID=A0A174GNQ1_FLAPL|nr:Uncharacterised protein [Flavonifractor plautii]